MDTITSTAALSRQPQGLPVGGQFASLIHPDPVLTLSGPATDVFDDRFEREHGQRLATELFAMDPIPIRTRLAAGRVAETLRDSYGEYLVTGEPELDRADALEQLSQALPHLSKDRRAHHLQLVGFAVHTEMKHHRDTGYVTNVDRSYELLVDEDDFPDYQEDAREANDANRDAWESLADTAMAHALAEDLVYSRPQAA